MDRTSSSLSLSLSMYSPSSNRIRFGVRNAVVVANVSCGCRRPKLTSLLSSSSSLPKPKNPKTTSTSLSPSAAATTTSSNSSHWDASLTTTSSSSNGDTSSSSLTDSPRSRKKVSAASSAKKKIKGKAVKGTATKKGVVEESEAVVKESSDPYVDFRESMLDMVAEKEIYAWEDLRDLLNRLLDLNSPYHHHLILRAFAEILNLLFSPPSPASAIEARGRGSAVRGGSELEMGKSHVHGAR